MEDFSRWCVTPVVLYDQRLTRLVAKYIYDVLEIFNSVRPYFHPGTLYIVTALLFVIFMVTSLFCAKIVAQVVLVPDSIIIIYLFHKPVLL